MGHAEHATPLFELAPAPVRGDHAVILNMVRHGARVLDVGCGEGALLTALQREQAVRGRGLDLNQASVNACVAKGLTALQGDADRDLGEFPDSSFDYVIFA